jgi:mono/diheme cytochrome c family protein
VLEEAKLYVRLDNRVTPAEVFVKSQTEQGMAVEWLRHAPTLEPHAAQKKFPTVIPIAALDRGLPPRGGTYALRRPEEQRLPPSLRTVGRKLDPEWLKKFLRDPKRVRPEGGPVMPTFPFAEGEAEALVEYFRTRDGAEPEDREGRLTQEQVEARFDEFRKAEQVLRTNCAACHSVDGEGKTLSVDLGQVHARLQRPWLEAFLKDPGSIYPRTAMPQAPPGLVDILLNYDRFRAAKLKLGDANEVLQALKGTDDVKGVLARLAREPALEDVASPAIELALRRGQEVRAELEALLDSPSAVIRLAAVEGLNGASDKVVERLKDKDAGVRKAALQSLRNPKFASEVATFLENERLAPVALDVLERMGAKDQSAAIAACLKKEGAVRVRAAQALGALQAKDQVPALRAVLGDANASVRWAALLALARLGEGGVEKFLQDPEPCVRAAAAACMRVKAELSWPYDELTEQAVREGAHLQIPDRPVESGVHTIREWLKILDAETSMDVKEGRVVSRGKFFELLNEIGKRTGGVFEVRGGRLVLAPIERR